MNIQAMQLLLRRLWVGVVLRTDAMAELITCPVSSAAPCNKVGFRFTITLTGCRSDGYRAHESCSLQMTVLPQSAQLAPCSFLFSIFNDGLNKLVFILIIRRTACQHSRTPLRLKFLLRSCSFPSSCLSACYVSTRYIRTFSSRASPQKSLERFSNAAICCFKHRPARQTLVVSAAKG